MTVTACLASLSYTHAQEGGGDEWVRVATRHSLTIYNRSRTGSKVKELKAIGVIKAAPAAVRKAINDIEGYPRFMPYTGEARVISRDTNSNSMVVYERLVMPLVSDRDFAIRMCNEARCSPDGSTNYVSRWKSANEFAPPEQSGVVRITTNEGSWTLNPLRAADSPG